MYWQLLLAKVTATRSPQHFENERQLSVNNFQLHILDNLCADWLQTSIHQIVAAFMGRNYIDMLAAALGE